VEEEWIQSRRERSPQNGKEKQKVIFMEEESNTEDLQKNSKTERFAQWLMDRAEKKEQKETSLESLMKFNVFLSISTLVAVAGSTVADYILMAYVWL
jgi:hypothetical protein